MRLVIVTGMSGAGKSQAIRFLEDMGYFCMDNLPPSLVPQFLQLCLNTGGNIQRVALGADIRGGTLFDVHGIMSLAQSGAEDLICEILFMDAESAELITRYKETRRDHPLARHTSLEEGIAREREQIAPLREKANYVIDTTNLSTQKLRARLAEIFEDSGASTLRVQVMSFGFKHGIPNDADMVLDVRFLPNPYYIPHMRALTGRDDAVRDYVMDSEDAQGFMQRLNGMMEFLMPRYLSEGKTRVVIAIGCTGGVHRSVAIADKLAGELKEMGYEVMIRHRDAPFGA